MGWQEDAERTMREFWKMSNVYRLVPGPGDYDLSPPTDSPLDPRNDADDDEVYYLPENVLARLKGMVPTTQLCDEAAGCIEGLLAEITALRTKLHRRNEALEIALEFIEDQSDVVDGDYGQPAPNAAMSTLTSMDLALGKLPPF